MATSNEKLNYLTTCDSLKQFLTEELENSQELNQGKSGNIDAESYQKHQEELFRQLIQLLTQSSDEVNTTGFIKNQSKFSESVSGVFSRLYDTKLSKFQKDKIDTYHLVCEAILDSSSKLAATEIKSCHVVDIWAGGLKATRTLIPLIKENLGCLEKSSVKSIQAMAKGQYGDKDGLVVEQFIEEIKRNPINEKTLETAFKKFREHPMAFALLNDVVNEGGGPQKRPPHKIILHCDIGVDAETGINIPSLQFAGDVKLTQGDLNKLRANFKKHMAEVTANNLDVLYIGLGHGGDVPEKHNLRRQMSGILGSDWVSVLNDLANQGTHARVIIAESCYSAAFTKELNKLLTTDGMMQLETIECTPEAGLTASLRQISAKVKRDSFYTVNETEDFEESAKLLLSKLGKQSDDEALLPQVSNALLSIANKRYAQYNSSSQDDNSRKQFLSKPYTEAELKTEPIIELLMKEASNMEIPTADVFGVSTILSSQKNPWGLVKMSVDPTKSSFKELEKSLNNTNAVILFNDKLFYADKNKQELKEIDVSDDKQGDFNALKEKFADTYKLADLNELKLITSLTGQSLGSDFNIWTYYDKDTLKPKAVDSLNNLNLAVKEKLTGSGMNDAQATALSAAYAEDVRAFMSSFPPAPDPKFPQFKEERIKKQLDFKAKISDSSLVPYPIPTKAMLEIGHNNASYARISPPINVVETKGTLVKQAIDSLNELSKASTGKCVMTKEQAYLPNLKTEPRNAGGDWELRRGLITKSIMEVYPKAVIPIAETRQELYLTVNSLEKEAKHEPLVSSSNKNSLST